MQVVWLKQLHHSTSPRGVLFVLLFLKCFKGIVSQSSGGREISIPWVTPQIPGFPARVALSQELGLFRRVNRNLDPKLCVAVLTKDVRVQATA